MLECIKIWYNSLETKKPTWCKSITLVPVHHKTPVELIGIYTHKETFTPEECVKLTRAVEDEVTQLAAPLLHTLNAKPAFQTEDMKDLRKVRPDWHFQFQAPGDPRIWQATQKSQPWNPTKLTKEDLEDCKELWQAHLITYKPTWCDLTRITIATNGERFRIYAKFRDTAFKTLQHHVATCEQKREELKNNSIPTLACDSATSETTNTAAERATINFKPEWECSYIAVADPRTSTLPHTFNRISQEKQLAPTETEWKPKSLCRQELKECQQRCYDELWAQRPKWMETIHLTTEILPGSLIITADYFDERSTQHKPMPSYRALNYAYELITKTGSTILRCVSANAIYIIRGEAPNSYLEMAIRCRYKAIRDPRHTTPTTTTADVEAAKTLQFLRSKPDCSTTKQRKLQ